MRSSVGWVLGLGWWVLACSGTSQDEPLTSLGSGGTNAEGNERAGAGNGGAGNPCGSADPTLAEADAEELFGFATVPTFDLFLPADDWEALELHAVDEQFTEAEACFEGRSIGRVGLRFKGSYGSLYNCFEEPGVNTCRKLGMKLKFDKYDPDQRFFGLKRLNLQGNRYDATYLKERLAYDIYRAAGIVSPRAAWALVRVNDEPQGLFGMVEAIDGRFTADRWPENGDQNLYKETWPINTDAEWVTERLRTNEETADVSAFVAFSQAMLDVDETDGERLRETLGRFVDLDYFARYMAADDAVAAYDGVTAYYTSSDALWSGNHNFYLYQEAPEHFTIIPWDLESSMLPNTGFGDVPHWTRVPEDCGERYHAWGTEVLAIAPGCDRVFRALAADLTSYREAGEALLAGPFSEEMLLAAIDEHAAFIREHAVADPHGPGETAFESDLQYLKSQLPLLVARFEHLLTGDTWTSLSFGTTVVNGFEEQDDFGLVMGPEFLANPTSTISIAINTTNPMGGGQDVLMSFEYRNEDEPWQQWIHYRAPLAEGLVDVRSMTGIRMWVRADQPRILRFDLDSPEESAAVEGIRLGWEVPLTSEPTQVEVRFADARVPDWAIDQGRDPGDDPQAILANVSGLAFHPMCVNRGSTGFLPEGETDAGFFAVDDLEFFR
ncbi:MAG: CotH kinase family protein [Polyangiaceae bacterium]|nr:CotH kinase family protein [Polyangiaceae bacterium]